MAATGTKHEVNLEADTLSGRIGERKVSAGYRDRYPKTERTIEWGKVPFAVANVQGYCGDQLSCEACMLL